MRNPGTYPIPRYADPLDRRLVSIIQASDKSRASAVNILGIPFDGAVLGRKGAKDGPAAIRQAMSGFSNYNVELKVGLDGARIFDLGDLALENDDVIKAHKEIESEVHEDLDRSSLLVLLGGDNSVSLPALAALERKFGEIGLIVVDSHFDLRGKIDGKPTSGSSYGLAMETLTGLEPRRVVEIGIHGFLNARRYAEKAEKLGVSIFTGDDVRDSGPETVARKAYSIASKGAKAVYLSLDLDAVDLAWVSGVSAPSAGGLSSIEFFKIVHTISRMGLVKCMDLVELAPSLDPTGRSQVVAATALSYAFAGFFSRKR
jgi:formiminoglutamase